MTRFEQKTTPIIYWAIAAALAAVFVADLFAPLGIAVWIVYLLPVVLSLFVWHALVPIAVAGCATAFMLIGYFFSPPGVSAGIARINRGFGVFTVWIVAITSYYFIRNKLLVRKQQWIQKGQTELSEKMGGDHKLQELGENVLGFVSQYVGAHAAAFFIEDGASFRRVATYAVPLESKVPEQFSPGDGLLGQAAKDGCPLLVHDIPEGYFSIGSGLGQSRPRHLVVAPVKVDGIVNGVIELGYFHPVYDSDTELLERVSESIGVAIRSAKYRTRQKELLEETQRQGEELQAQGEELRVTNEELSEQSRALKESQVRLEQQQAELEQTNQQLEEQSQLLEAEKNNLSRAKAELETKAFQLEQVSRYKSDFLANMSHELRTPLNSSLILAKLLAENRDGNLTGDQIRYAETIYAAGNDLLTLITDILDLSKIEAGRMEVHSEKLPISRVLENLRRTFEPIATEKGLGFRMQTAPDTPESMETDPQRVEQVLKNILANAMKFTEQGEVLLEVSRPKEGWLAFSVRDTGIGIATHQQQTIFEPFRQADGTTNRKYGGTGLGLSISRELVRLLGGEIQLASEPGKGSTFTVMLPEVYKHAGPSTPSPKAASLPLPGEVKSVVEETQRREEIPQTHPKAKISQTSREVNDDRERLTANSRVILVIEDDQSFARILYDLAHEQQFQCLVAGSAEEGLSLALQFKPSAVVLDVGLPDTSGLSVLDRLKADSRMRHIPVHVVSATDYTQTALTMGAVGYMLKPVTREQLIQAFEQLESRLTQHLRRVLVVEDDARELESLRLLLGSRDVETVGANNAAECLLALKNTTFDCMVLDLNLPDASGFALLKTLSQEEHYSFPPVIVYTGRELTPDEEQQLRKYSKSIIIKGAKSPERLLDEVTLFLHQVVSELPEEQQKLLQKARSRDAVLENRRILVVEDDVRNVFALTSVLEPRGAKIEIARNGREALAALEKSWSEPAQRVDLVLMDIMMPEMDGLTAMREIRKRPEWKKLPIIALTAKAMPEDQARCLDAGANDYMAKPLDVEKLLSLVRVWMPR